MSHLHLRLVIMKQAIHRPNAVSLWLRVKSVLFMYRLWVYSAMLKISTGFYPVYDRACLGLQEPESQYGHEEESSIAD